ncbi:hypothetical protein [Zhihengliuella halotolerans]|uniref:Carbohydrate binding protein n=1 Tax=Zhihengliuella halotolerans TaxID=370736 RepID=A0A4Q8ACY3_9MICC|nr:hypothetical protein [Zhihengliuella halotolerans]RZU62072.1 hypothetical protein EV380_1660 [Zhihengliuella halotolerans]
MKKTVWALVIVAVLLMAAVYPASAMLLHGRAENLCAASPPGEEWGDSSQVDFAPNPLPNFRCRVEFADGRTHEYRMGWIPTYRPGPSGAGDDARTPTAWEGMGPPPG